MAVKTDVIYSINGPVVTVKRTKSFFMLEMVYVGNLKLIGEVISVNESFTTIQVYEETTSLKPGEPVVGSGSPLCVTLGPGLMSNIFDGIERPLKDIEQLTGPFIGRGVSVSSINTDKKWDVTFTVKVGDILKPGDIYATVKETSIITHKCMLQPDLPECTVVKMSENGEYSVLDEVLTVKTKDGKLIKLNLIQKWPIRTSRPIKERKETNIPLITGQRIIDTLFPVAKGGTAAVPGGFGTGKTMTQHQLAKWCDADIIVYVGCGERGNEMSQVLEEFTNLLDPKSGKPMTERTILIANTSNMPVAAREASIYTGITLAEYYRDMGYNVAIMADSTSRWAEALREISGRLEEMPAEEGFPAYLPSRLASFYERSGLSENLNGTNGSVTIIGAVSPQGSDFSEPVTQNTKRFIRCFWALDKSLAYERHYPAINWMNSYSEYYHDLNDWYVEKLGKEFIDYREKISNILHKENELMEIVRLIGADVLPDEQKLIIEVARVIRVGFLQQNAFHKDDTFVPLDKQNLMMKTILDLNKKCKQLIDASIPINRIKETGILDYVVKMKYDIPNDNLEKFSEYESKINEVFDKVLKAH